ncbi:hypothetical protein V3C99_007883, partial [Haemonchus contortus]
QKEEWIADRAASFTNYPRNPAESRRHMAQRFNAACSVLVTVNALNDDKTTHRLTATTPSSAAFPFRYDFIITNVFRVRMDESSTSPPMDRGLSNAYLYDNRTVGALL